MITRLINFIKPWAGWLFIVWFVSVMVLSVLPSVGKTTSVDIGKIEIRLDYLYHIIIYLTGTFFAILRAVANLRRPYTALFWQWILIAVAIMVVLALSQEYIQKLIPSRAFNINDIISNLIGVALGTTLTLFILLHPVGKG